MEYRTDRTPLTPAELVEIAKLVDPIRALIDHYIAETPTLPFETILEALTRLTDYYTRLEAHIMAQIEAHIAAKEDSERLAR